MKERIQEFIDNKGISAGELATLLEVQRSNISHILNGRNKPGASLIEKMLIVFPELNARWLLTGEGNMLDEGGNNNPTVKSVREENASFIKQNDNKKIVSGEKQIEKIVLLYTDGTFVSFNK